MSTKMKTEKEILAERAIFRANSGFHFIEACLDHFHKGGTDAAYSRSLYILFSYNFELMLKARVLLTSSLTTRKELLQSVKSHDLVSLSEKLSQQELNDLDIAKIEKIDNAGFEEHKIILVTGKTFTLQEFTDVRYDFGKDTLRRIDYEESAQMKAVVEILIKMTKKIMEMI